MGHGGAEFGDCLDDLHLGQARAQGRGCKAQLFRPVCEPP
jgi:hypothetical protein